MKKESSGSATLLYALLGFLFGLVMVALGTVIALISTQQDFTLENIIRVHLTTPLLWVIDSFPFFMAAILGILGSREGQLNRLRREGRETQRRTADIGRLNAELAKKDQERQETEAIISRGKREWEATFDSVDDMILLVDENGTLIRCNKATTYALQKDFPQIIGKPVNELFFGSEGIEWLPVQKTELKFPALEGWYEVSSDPLTYEGVQQGNIFIVRNITDRKQAALDLERQKQFYESLVKNSPVGIVTLSLDHRVVACNPAFEVMFGYPQSEVIGQNIDSLISPSELIDESLMLTYNVSQGEVVRKITRRRHKDGTQIDVELFGIPVVLWGKQIGILGMYHNVTDLMRMGEPAYEAVEEVAPQEPEAVAEQPEESEEPIAALAALAAAAAVKATETEEQPVAVAPFTDFDEAELEAEASAPSPARQRLIKIETIEGIGPVYAAQLGEFGVVTTEDLLNSASTRKGRQELAEKSGISEKLILKWVNRADLMRVPGIGEEYSDLLEVAGVDTVRELRNRNSKNLYKALLDANEQKKLVRRAPHQSEVDAWVAAAKEIEPRVTY
jgi:PAS domain S-box-containing protein